MLTKRIVESGLCASLVMDACLHVGIKAPHYFEK